jgi:hypothetical protein
LTVGQFIVKWKRAELKERAAAQEHFLDLCRLLDHPTPAEADATDSTFCFEKGTEKRGGGDGYAEVWKRGFLGWEIRGNGRTSARPTRRSCSTKRRWKDRTSCAGWSVNDEGEPLRNVIGG